MCGPLPVAGRIESSAKVRTCQELSNDGLSNDGGAGAGTVPAPERRPAAAPRGDRGGQSAPGSLLQDRMLAAEVGGQFGGQRRVLEHRIVADTLEVGDLAFLQ